MPSSIVALYEVAAAYYATSATFAFAVNMVASAIISKAFLQPNSYGSSGASSYAGNPQQVPPATNNKLPVVYGSTYVGGIVTDLSITSDNQDMYYVLALSEVTGTTSADTISFGNIYWGGKLVTFASNGYSVASLTDTSTGVVDTAVAGYMDIYLYSNGSMSSTNSPYSAIQVMNSPGLIYTWDSNKLMTNCAFAIIHLKYNSSIGITGLQKTNFNVINSRSAPGDCFLDYLTDTVYGAGIPLAQIDTASLTALNTYSNQSFTFTTYSGGTSTQTRFRFDGVIDTSKSIMTNLQDMSACCDCLIKYNEITGLWGVIVQTPTYSVAMDINDSNMTSAIQISPLDITASYNICQVNYPDSTNQDAFASVSYNLATIAPALLFPNEPINQQTLSLPLTNNDVRAQYLATRFLKSGREDLQVLVNINFVGLQIEAGDIVTVTNANYGWVAKLFRVNKIVEQFASTGEITASLTLGEYNPTVYNDTNITQFSPVANTGIPSPTIFGTIPAPTISGIQTTAAIPSFAVNVTTSSTGIIQYAEIWYSAFSNPTTSQLIFAGTTALQSNGNPYLPNTAIPAATISGIPAGDWYFFSKMVNSLGTSQLSSASSLFQWRPMTFQYTSRYLSIAYATSSTGGGFTFTRAGATYFGVKNQNTTTPDSTPADYQWYPVSFGTSNYLYYCNRTNYLTSFASGGANQAAGSAAFVPSDTTNYDPSIWFALPDGSNIIDLNQRTGQVLQLGTTNVGSGQIAVTNNPQGQVVASLAQLLDFGTGVTTKTSSVATLTIDVYGRVVGFSTPDSFYYSMTAYIASSGQTVFPVTRGSEYVTGNCLVFDNGLLLNTSEYTDNAGNVTFATGRTAGDDITIISMASVGTGPTTYNSFTRNSVTLTSQSNYTASGFTLVSGNELLFLNGTVVNAQDYNITGQTISFVSDASGDLEVIQWANNNLGVPNGTPVNTDIYTTIGQSLYSFSFDPNAFNLYNNGVLQLETQDYSVTTGSYTLATTPTSNQNILVQQTFQRTGAV